MGWGKVDAVCGARGASPGGGMTARSAFLFSLVALGSAFAVGCGGKAAENSSRVSESGDGDGDGAGDGDGVATGGNFGGDGDIVIVASGGTGMGGSPFACAPTQWDCEEVGSTCNWPAGSTPGECSCDSSRPESPEDCPEGSDFVCMSGTTFESSVSFACECVPAQDSCAEACDIITDAASSDCYEDEGDNTIHCFC